MTWATDRLDAIKAGGTLPPVVATLQLGGLDDWGDGWVRKTWTPKPDLLNSDGSLFGGYVAALADQMLAFAAMTVVPGDSLFRTTNLMVNFVRVGRAAPLAIEARVVAVTKRVDYGPGRVPPRRRRADRRSDRAADHRAGRDRLTPHVPAIISTLCRSPRCKPSSFP